VHHRISGMVAVKSLDPSQSSAIEFKGKLRSALEAAQTVSESISSVLLKPLEFFWFDISALESAVLAISYIIGGALVRGSMNTNVDMPGRESWFVRFIGAFYATFLIIWLPACVICLVIPDPFAAISLSIYLLIFIYFAFFTHDEAELAFPSSRRFRSGFYSTLVLPAVVITFHFVYYA